MALVDRLEYKCIDTLERPISHGTISQSGVVLQKDSCWVMKSRSNLSKGVQSRMLLQL